MNKNAGTRSMPVATAPAYIVVNQQPQQQIQIAPPKKSNAGMIWLTIFFPFVTAWIILFSTKYEKGMRIFALVWSVAMTVSAIGSGSIPAAPVFLAPVIGYGIKLLKDKKKAKEATGEEIEIAA